MTESKLKPCPFCGGSAKFRRRKMGGYLEHYVKCRSCNARSGVVAVSVLSSKAQIEEAEREAIREWQRRAHESD